MSYIKNAIERKILKNTVAVGDCLLWTKRPDKYGYGRICLGHPCREIFAHRAAAYLYGIIDSLSSELNVNHKVECKNRNCIAKRHLYAGTQVDNMMDRSLVGNSGNLHNLKNFCDRGHEYTKENTHYGMRGSRKVRFCRACRKIQINTPEHKQRKLEMQRIRRKAQREYRKLKGRMAI